MDPEKYFDEASTLVSEEYQKNDCDLRALPPEFVILVLPRNLCGFV
jgi:hypothetical protein